MVEDRFLLHASNRKDWRLRNIEEHPLDPGWEAGQYCICHEKVRAKIELGVRIFDVVVKDGTGVIRSSFIISGAEGEGNSRVLYFDGFHFADGEPIELPGPYIQYRQMRMNTWIEKYGSHPLLGKLVERYAYYKKGQKPVSVDQVSWSMMVTRGSQVRKERRLCGPAGI